MACAFNYELLLVNKFNKFDCTGCFRVVLSIVISRAYGFTIIEFFNDLIFESYSFAGLSVYILFLERIGSWSIFDFFIV